LKEQLAIGKQELRVLGRRPQQVEPEEAAELQEAVTQRILARRKTGKATEQLITVQEKRAFEKDAIMKIVRDHRELLVKWDDILQDCLRGATPQQLLQLDSVTEFIDGFAIRAPANMTATQLRALLKQCGLDVKQPKP